MIPASTSPYLFSETRRANQCFENLSANEAKAELTGDLKRSELRMYQLFEKYFPNVVQLKQEFLQSTWETVYMVFGQP